MNKKTYEIEKYSIIVLSVFPKKSCETLYNIFNSQDQK